MSTDGPRPHRLAGLTSTGARQHALNQGGEAQGPAGALTQGNQGQCCDWDIGKKEVCLVGYKSKLQCMELGNVLYQKATCIKTEYIAEICRTVIILGEKIRRK